MSDSPWNLDEKLYNFFESKKIFNGFYIEAGAVNGVWQSNTTLLEQKLNWSGLLIEPDPKLYFECLNNRTQKPSGNNYIINSALVDSKYSEEFVEGSFSISVNDYNNCLQGNINYKNKDYNIKNGMNTIKVPALKLKNILSNLNIKKINLLSLDVEGMEIASLDGLDLNNNRPEYIIIETTTSEEKRKKIKNYLLNYSYKFMEQLTPNDAFYMDETI